MTDPGEDQTYPAGVSRAGASMIVKLMIVTVLQPALVFLAAGRWDWPAAWALAAVRVLLFPTTTLWLARRHPDLVNERGKPGPNAKRWDVILLRFYIPVAFALGVVAGQAARSARTRPVSSVS